MTDSALLVSARQWVIDNYPYNSTHLLKTLDWLDRIAPEATEAMRLAALTHDMERAFPGADQPVLEKIDGLEKEDEYNKLHSARSARIVGEWLHQQGADATLTGEVERFIIAHEVGGWPEANLVQAADSLSFLETNVDLFLGFARDGKRTLDEVAIKFFTTYNRIQVLQARELALPMYDQVKERFKGVKEEILRSLPREEREKPGYILANLVFSEPDSFDLLLMFRFDMEQPIRNIQGIAEFFRQNVDQPDFMSLSEFRQMVKMLKRSADLVSMFFEPVRQYAFLRYRHVTLREKQPQ